MTTGPAPAGEDLHDLAQEDLVGAVTYEEWLGAPALSYPNRPPTLPDVLDRAVRRFGPRTFLTAPEGELTYAEFAELVEGAVERLAEEGIGPDDRLGVVARNGLDLAVALFACARSGAVLVGLSPRTAPEQWACQLRHSRAGLALAQDDLVDRLARAGSLAGLAPDRARPLGDHLTGRHRPWSYRPDQRPDEAAAFAVVYTSGTTGRPKASRVVHRASVHSGLSYARALQLTADDCTAVVFPLTYISALHAHLLPMLVAGGRCVLVADASPRHLVSVIAGEGVSWVYVVPSLWQLLLRVDGFSWPELACLRLGGFGGAPMPRATIDQLRRRLPQMRLHDIYGLSETHSPATVLLDSELRRKPGSVGRPLPCMEAKVVGEDGDELPCGQPGELLLRGSLVTTGYEGDPEATAAAISEGWFRTGDVARIDAEGYVYILDRKKDMINRGGHKVFSAEVERLLREHARIADAAVVGIPDRVAGEAVAAFVVPAAPGGIDADEVRLWVRDRLADYAVPRVVRVVGGLPRNPTGKVDKPALRDRLSGPR